MKISVIFVAGAQAFTCGDRDPQPCDFGEWIENNWWASAVESFNFASNNWKEFTSAVKSVSRADNFCNNYNDIMILGGCKNFSKSFPASRLRWRF